jgi:hypothetical protein
MSGTKGGAWFWYIYDVCGAYKDHTNWINGITYGGTNGILTDNFFS